MATAMPVRSSEAGIESTTSCGSSTSERGATASNAATKPMPIAPPKASASSVIGPPASGTHVGRLNRTSAPVWLARTLTSAARMAAATSANASGFRFRSTGSHASKTFSATSATRTR